MTHRSAVSCDYPPCITSTYFPFNIEYSKITEGLRQQGWIARKAQDRRFDLCAEHASFSLMKAQGLESYLLGDRRYVSGIRAKMTVEEQELASRIADSLRSPMPELPDTEDLLDAASEALAAERKVTHFRVLRWEAEAVVLGMIAFGHLVKVQFQDGGLLRTAYREEGEVERQFTTAPAYANELFVGADNRLYAKTNPDADVVSSGSLLAWPEQVYQYFPGLDHGLESNSVEVEDTAYEDELAALSRGEHHRGAL